MAFNQSASLESLFVTRYLKGPAKGSFVKLISYLSIFAIGLGVLNMVVVLSIMEGFSGNMQKRLLGSDPHIVVHNSTARLKERLIRELDVKGLISNFTKQDVILRSLDGTYMGAVAYGVEPEVLAQTARRIRQRFEVTESGAVITTQDSSQSDPVNIRLGEKMVFVGDGLARSLALFDGDEAQVIAPESLLLPEGELPIYEKVRIHSRVTTDIPDVDAHTLFFEHGRGLKKLSDSASVEAGVEIRLEDPSLTDHVMAKLKKMG
ncbi:MAG: hypothetical protein IT289_00725, partial [Oligoflexia bacterium]|nr:hypothetical protein [Oligoflexia bacterium]